MLSFFEHYAGLFIFPVMALFLSLVFTGICIRLLPKLGYLDKPGGRHIHSKPIPRGGGIAVILAFFITLFFFALDSKLAEGGMKLFARLAVPAAVLGVLGMLDDRFELKSTVKLLVQLLVAGIIWFSGDELRYVVCGIELPWFVSLILCAVWVIGIINAFNLIDGLDGLAAGLAIVSSCCMAIWFLIGGGNPAGAVCMLIMAGACLGFLRYNFHPAKIFLGDTGSTFIGLIFAVVGLSTLDRVVTFTSLLLPLLAVGVPLFDVCLAIWRRSTRKLLNPEAGGIMDGDQDHLHHRLLRQTRKQTTAALMMYLLACLFSAVALAFLLLRDSAPAIAYMILLVAVVICVRRLAVVELYDSAELIKRGLSKPHRGVLMTMTHPFIDFLIVTCSALVSCFFMTRTLPTFQLFLFFFVPVAVTLCCSKTYRVYWLRAGLYNYWHLAIMLGMGSVVSILLLYVFKFPYLVNDYGTNHTRFVSGAMLFVLFNIVLVELERFMLNYAENFLFRKLYLQYQPVDRVLKTLVYGGGLNCRLYIGYLFSHAWGERPEELVGMLDDDPALQGFYVYGVKVMGGVQDLEEIYRKTPFDKVIIATDLASREKVDRLSAFCREHKIEITKFCLAESSDPSMFCPIAEHRDFVPGQIVPSTAVSASAAEPACLSTKKPEA